ncbi:MAG: CoA ester lyase [Chloroflexi bacterium]|nr:CoA ester lyase [Chloroflexota bacterium]
MNTLEPSSRVRRAILIMPGDDLKKISKGASLGVDSMIMDLEDGVALNNKERARQVVQQALTSGEIDFGKTERLVRLNQAKKGLQVEDITMTVIGKPDGYVLPKVESAREVQQLSHTLLEREILLGIEPGTIKLIALIETAKGIVNLPQIAQADSRLVALMFGAEDLAGSMGAIRSEGGEEVFYARSAVVLHAAAFGLQAIDTPFITIQAMEALKAETLTARRMGYTGKLAIHPSHVGLINEIFTPTDQEIDHAQRLIEAHEAKQADHTGAFAFEGSMVDMPMIRSAENVLARARAAGKL